MRKEETQGRETDGTSASALSISNPQEQITYSSVSIWISAELAPAVPPWFGEVTVIAQYLQHRGVLSTMEDRVRFARRRFGHYDLIDFVVVLLGYAISGERMLEAFYGSVHPFAVPFMALFERERLPHQRKPASR
jgi:hypothetical protein